MCRASGKASRLIILIMQAMFEVDEWAMLEEDEILLQFVESVFGTSNSYVWCVCFRTVMLFCSKVAAYLRRRLLRAHTEDRVFTCNQSKCHE